LRANNEKQIVSQLRMRSRKSRKADQELCWPALVNQRNGTLERVPLSVKSID